METKCVLEEPNGMLTFVKKPFVEKPDPTGGYFTTSIARLLCYEILLDEVL